MGYRGNPGFTEVGVESPCLWGHDRRHSFLMSRSRGSGTAGVNRDGDRGCLKHGTQGAMARLQ
jgi:hypothetical protein